MEALEAQDLKAGHLPKGWDVCRVGDLAIVNGKTIGRGYPHTQILYIDVASVDNGTVHDAQRLDLKNAPSRARRIVSKDDILISTVRPNLKHHAIIKNPTENTVASTGFAVITAKKVIPDFLYYCLTTNRYVNFLSTIADAHTSTYPSFNPGIIENSNIAVPTIPEQKAIAKILSDLDEKIELNRQMNETLENIAHAIFKSWFIDFDPVRAKLSGKPIGLPNEIAKLFPSRLVESELGEIPEGWEVKTIQDIAERVAMGPFGSSIKVDTFVPEGIPVISGQHLRGFMVEDSDFNYVTVEHADKLKNANVKPGDVIFTHAGNIGQVAYVPENAKFSRYVISQRQFYLRCNLAQVSPSFMVFYFKTAEGQHRLLANASSSGVPSIAQPVTYLRTIPLILPPKAIMDIFDESLQPILRQFEAIRSESRILANLRDTLLPKLMSAEIRVTI